MIRTDDQLLTWLREHCTHDRVIRNALNMGQVVVMPDMDGGSWLVIVTSRRGITYRLTVVLHSVTGDPVRWYRMKGGEM